MSKKVCKNCGYKNDSGDVVCMGCGYPIGNDDGRFGDVEVEKDSNYRDDYGDGYDGYGRSDVVPDKEY